MKTGGVSFEELQNFMTYNTEGNPLLEVRGTENYNVFLKVRLTKKGQEVKAGNGWIITKVVTFGEEGTAIDLERRYTGSN
jgi:hypothetical protein